MAKNFAKQNPQQLLKISGKTTFVEVLNTFFGINKLGLTFAKYDEKKPEGERMTDNITIFMSFDKALLLSKDILSGKIAGLAQKEKAKGETYPQSIYTEMGGTSAATLERKGKARPDKKSESRQFKIHPGAKAPFMLVAERGAGEENQTGLIVPKKVETKVMVPCSADDLKTLAVVIESHINAYRASKYVDGTLMENPYFKENNPTPSNEELKKQVMALLQQMK